MRSKNARKIFSKNIHSILVNHLLVSGIWLTVVNVTAGVLGYIYQYGLARWLSPNDFGVLSSITALGVFVSTPLSAYSLALCRRVSALTVQKDTNALFLFYEMSRRHLAIGLVLFVLASFFIAPSAGFYLRVDDNYQIYIFALFLAASTFGLFNLAIMQGIQKFKWQGCLLFLNVFLKVAFAFFVLAVAPGVSGILLASLFSGTICCIIGHKLVSGTLNTQKFKRSIDGPRSLSFLEILPVVIATSAFAAMTQLDIVLVNWLHPLAAGDYAVAAIFGKAILYLPGGLVLALYPKTAYNDANNAGSLGMLLQICTVSLVLSLSAALLFFFFSDQIIALLFGEKYFSSGEILKWYGLAMIPFSLVYILEHFLIAKRRILFSVVFIIIAPLQILVIFAFNSDVIFVVLTLFGSGILVMLFGGAVLWYEHFPFNFKRKVERKLK